MQNLINGTFSGFTDNSKGLFIPGNNYFLQLFYLSGGERGKVSVKKSIDALAFGLIFHFAFYSRQVMYHINCIINFYKSMKTLLRKKSFSKNFFGICCGC